MTQNGAHERESTPRLLVVDVPGALDTSYDVVAPENVAFQYRLAGPFVRAAAYAWDLAILGVYFVASFMTILWAVVRISRLFSSDMIWLAETLIIVNAIFIFWFALPIAETYFHGKTLGKKFMGLRVISTTGRPISFSQAFVRNILRSADLTLGVFSVLIMAINNKMARVGDLVTGTIVVNERLQRKGMTKTTFTEPVIATVASNIPDDYVANETTLKALALYASRRLEISSARRYEIAAPFAAKLVKRTDFPYQVDPDAFLCALYSRSFEGDSTRS